MARMRLFLLKLAYLIFLYVAQIHCQNFQIVNEEAPQPPPFMDLPPILIQDPSFRHQSTHQQTAEKLGLGGHYPSTRNIGIPIIHENAKHEFILNPLQFNASHLITGKSIDLTNLDSCSLELLTFVQTYVLGNLAQIITYINDINRNLQTKDCTNIANPITPAYVAKENLNLSAVISSLNNLLDPSHLSQIIVAAATGNLSKAHSNIKKPVTRPTAGIGPPNPPDKGAASIITATPGKPNPEAGTAQLGSTTQNVQNDDLCPVVTEGNNITRGDIWLRGHVLKNLTLTKKSDNWVYARFGLKDQGDAWKFYNEIKKEASIDLLSDTDISNIEKIVGILYQNPASGNLSQYFRVESDLLLAIQNRASKNPSNLVVRFLNGVGKAATSNSANKLSNSKVLPPLFADKTLCLDTHVNSDLTRISLSSDKLRVRCFGSPRGNSCGKCGLPQLNTESDSIILKRAILQPRGPGSATPDGQWRRNQYLFKGTYYHVFLRIQNCKPARNIIPI